MGVPILVLLILLEEKKIMDEFEMRVINCTLNLCFGIVGLTYLVSACYGLKLIGKGLVKFCANRIAAIRKAKTVCK